MPIKPFKWDMILILILTTCLSWSCLSQANLTVGFYDKTCPMAEAVVRDVVREAAALDGNNVPILLRLHFHDCFVEGCDGSILIDTKLETDERHAFGHQGVRGFDIIDRAKGVLEGLCPGTVSCADIVALAARDAVFLVNGPSYEVETGRRDGLVSNKTMANDMPDMGDSIQKLKAKFSRKGLSEKDLVLLSAAHTIGTAACFFMTQRLYTFGASGTGSDPSINPVFLPELKAACPQGGDVNARVLIDRGSMGAFDAHILHNIRMGFTVLQSDAAVYQDAATRAIVDSYFLNPFLGPSFEADFAASMVKMGKIGVLTGPKGTIRRLCSSFH